jgi:hypothetical protein
MIVNGDGKKLRTSYQNIKIQFCKRLFIKTNAKKCKLPNSYQFEIGRKGWCKGGLKDETNYLSHCCTPSK